MKKLYRVLLAAMKRLYLIGGPIGVGKTSGLTLREAAQWLQGFDSNIKKGGGGGPPARPPPPIFV